MTELQHEIKNPTFAAMTLAYVSTSTLRTRPRQVRRHTQSKIRRLAKFMEQSRVIVPLVVDQENVVVLGNARLQALNLLGVDSAPVIRVTHLDEAMIRALILADNQFTLNADWYKEALREELLHLAPLVVDFGLELTDLGFETGQLDFTIGEIELAGNGDSLLPPPAKPLTKQGYLWIMGPHILACGDARHEKTYASVLDTSLADMVFGDLPYNVPVLGHVSGIVTILRH
ncbi:MAG: ParB N-terminal domain-containing protein [Alphaproteobacteria bacterium]|nr:ParB N-terminal domain-containing protein [Alphaproteobacteria bacterium]